jgi:ABC-2 type transport system ATP-binding protein
VYNVGEIITDQLSKRFGELKALNRVDIVVQRGSVFGLLGPNGAGKSTTTRLLSTVLKPSFGTAQVGGFDIIENPVKVREITGVLPEEGSHTLYPSMTAYQNLEYFAKLYNVPDEEIPGRIEELLTFMELWERKDDKAGELSTGNRQRLALCRALLHRPEVLLLDEPTSALDPVAAKRVRELILSLARKYKQTFFINSHNLSEVQRICDHIAIIDKGQILLTGTTAELRAQLHAKQEYMIRVAGDIEKARSIAESYHFVESMNVGVDSLIVTIDNPFENNSQLMQGLLAAGVNIIEFAEEEASLEDLYLEVLNGGGN